MKIVFNDATELQVQSVSEEDGKIVIKTISATTDELRTKFSDDFATKQMDVYEQSVRKASYEGYTELYRLEEYQGTIRGVIMYQSDKTPESVAESVKALQEESRAIKEQNESMSEKIDEVIGLTQALSGCIKAMLTEAGLGNLLDSNETE